MLSSGDKSIPPKESDEAEQLPNLMPEKTDRNDKPRYTIHYNISGKQIQLYFLNGTGNPDFLSKINMTIELQLKKAA